MSLSFCTLTPPLSRNNANILNLNINFNDLFHEQNFLYYVSLLLLIGLHEEVKAKATTLINETHISCFITHLQTSSFKSIVFTFTFSYQTLYNIIYVKGNTGATLSVFSSNFILVSLIRICYHFLLFKWLWTNSNYWTQRTYDQVKLQQCPTLFFFLLERHHCSTQLLLTPSYFILVMANGGGWADITFVSVGLMQLDATDRRSSRRGITTRPLVLFLRSANNLERLNRCEASSSRHHALSGETNELHIDSSAHRIC
jgi:hypothetical protein